MATVDLFAGAPVDTVKRVSYHNSADAQRAYWDGQITAGKGTRYPDAEYRKLGEPIVIAASVSDAIRYSYGAVHEADGIRVYFAVTDIEVVNAQKVRVFYEIDAWETLHEQFGVTLGPGHVSRISRFLDGHYTYLAQRFPDVSAVTLKYTYGQLIGENGPYRHRFGALVYVRKASTNRDAWISFDLTADGQPDYLDYTPIDALMHGDIAGFFQHYGITRYTETDVISVYLSPIILHHFGAQGVGDKAVWVDIPGQEASNLFKQLNRARTNPGTYNPWKLPLQWPNHPADALAMPFDRYAVEDMRGNIVWEVPVLKTPPASVDAYFDFGLNAASIKCDAGMGDEGRFTVPLEPVSFFIDSYAEYFARQRDSDVRMRQLQSDRTNWSNVAGVGTSAVQGALMGAAAGPLGAAAGAAAGLVGGSLSAIGTAAVNSHFMPKEQDIADAHHRAQRDELVMMGDAIVSIIADSFAGCRTVRIEWDQYSKRRFQQNIEVYGTIADYATSSVEAEMAEMVEGDGMGTPKNAILAMRADCEVTGPGPKAWKRQIHDRFAEGVQVVVLEPPKKEV